MKQGKSSGSDFESGGIHSDFCCHETQKGFWGALRFYFFPRKLHHCLWRSKHDLIYHRKGIPWLTQDVIPYLSAPRRTLLAKLSTQDKVAKVNTIRHCYHRYDLKSWKMACNWLMMRSSAEVWVIWPSRTSRRSASGHQQDWKKKTNRVLSMNRPAYGWAVNKTV